MHEENKNINKEVQTIKKKHFKMKKNALEGLNSKCDQVEERIRELKYRSYEMIQSEKQKENRMQKNEVGIRGHYKKEQ